jgi:hypothetical protein
MVKQLESLRVFLVGCAAGVKVNDVITVRATRTKGMPPVNVSYRIESIRYTSDSDWQAYASLEARAHKMSRPENKHLKKRRSA